MAAGFEEQGVEDVLTDTERRLLSEDTVRQTAYAVVALSSLTDEFGIDAELPEMADTLRTRMAEMSLKEQRRMRKALQRVGTLLVENKPTPVAEVVPIVSESKTTELVVKESEIVAERPKPVEVECEESTEVVESAEQPVDTAQLPDVEAVLVPAEEADDSTLPFDKKVVDKLYSRINAKSSIGELLSSRPYDEDEVVGLVALLAQEGPREKSGMMNATILHAILQGRSLEQINKEVIANGRRPLTVSARAQIISGTAPVSIAKYLEKLFAGSEAHEVQIPSVQQPAPKIVQAPAAVSKPRTVKPVPQATKHERPLEEEPAHVEIALRYREILGLDSAETAAWKAMLDPGNRNADFTRNKEAVCNKIVTELAARGWQNLHTGDFQKVLQNVEAMRIYKLLGLKYDSKALVSGQRIPKNLSVADQITDARRNDGRPSDVERDIYRALHAIARQLKENPKV